MVDVALATGAEEAVRKDISIIHELIPIRILPQGDFTPFFLTDSGLGVCVNDDYSVMVGYSWDDEGVLDQTCLYRNPVSISSRAASSRLSRAITVSLLGRKSIKVGVNTE